MTTVTFKSGVMACDSCFSYGGSVDTLGKKIVRLRSGALLGQAGDNDARDVIALLSTVKSVRQIPSRKDLLSLRTDFLGLLVTPSGRIIKVSTTFVSPENWTDETEKDLGAWEINHAFTAIGSGSDIAMGAMAAGADAKRAVMIACRYDMNSRPPVHALHLSKLKI